MTSSTRIPRQFCSLLSPVQAGPMRVNNRISETTHSPGSACPESGGLIDELYDLVPRAMTDEYIEFVLNPVPVTGRGNTVPCGH